MVDDSSTPGEEEEGEGGFVSTMDFGFNCSSGALKCVAISAHGKYLCCGGSDERIRIFNMAENRSMGELGLHEGAITSLAFFDDSHLISGSEDSSLRIWRCHDWECLHVLHGHKAAITRYVPMPFSEVNSNSNPHTHTDTHTHTHPNFTCDVLQSNVTLTHSSHQILTQP